MADKKYKLKAGKSPPGFEDIEVLLDLLEFLEEKREKLLEPIKPELDVIEKEIKNIKQKVKNLALKRTDKTIQIRRYKIIHCDGRTSWNTKTLEYLARKNKDIAKCKIKGKPWIMLKKG